jgi:type VI protein secretion system component Hcp
MKRSAKNQASQVTPNRRSLRIESLEDRKLMTVATELVQMPQESQIGSEHWPEPAAEIAVEKVTNGRQGYFSRGLHNNGAFREPTGHILWNTADDAGTSSNSYTDSGRITYYAYELKNVQVTSVVDQEATPAAGEDDHDASSYTEVEWTYLMQKKASLHDSVHCLTGQHDRPGQLVEKLGGQEGEPVTDLGSFSHNPEWLRGQEIVGGTMCSARSSNDPVFFSHHANVDKVFSDSVLSQQLDKPADNLQESCANGTFFSDAELNSVSTLKNKQEPYLTYKLKDVIVTSYGFHGNSSGDPLPSEEIALNEAETLEPSLNFEEIKVT